MDRADGDGWLRLRYRRLLSESESWDEECHELQINDHLEHMDENTNEGPLPSKMSKI